MRINVSQRQRENEYLEHAILRCLSQLHYTVLILLLVLHYIQDTVL